MKQALNVRIVEVGPRDGLQNVKQIVTTSIKIELIHRLTRAGLRHIEATAFVPPKWVPQMADHSEVLRSLPVGNGVTYSVLTPNLQGFEAAVACGATEVAVFASASETFSKRNINCSIDESLSRFEPLMLAARANGVKVRGYVSCVSGCPYEGDVAPKSVAMVAASLHQMGCYEVSLGDTIGKGTPGAIVRMLDEVTQRVPVTLLAGHFHDTGKLALRNILASYQFGVRTFDTSVGGLGGCPYAEGASGNVATEKVVKMFDDMGVTTGVDLAGIVECSSWISTLLNRTSASAI